MNDTKLQRIWKEEIRPTWGGDAHSLLRRLNTNDIVVGSGLFGTGKTNLLIPNIVDLAESYGYQARKLPDVDLVRDIADLIVFLERNEKALVISDELGLINCSDILWAYLRLLECISRYNSKCIFLNAAESVKQLKANHAILVEYASLRDLTVSNYALRCTHIQLEHALKIAETIGACKDLKELIANPRCKALLRPRCFDFVIIHAGNLQDIDAFRRHLAPKVSHYLQGGTLGPPKEAKELLDELGLAKPHQYP